MSVVVALALLTLVVLIWKIITGKSKPENAPPEIPAPVPFLGSALAYGLDPVKFLSENKKKLGDCFTFTLFGRKMTFCLDPDGNNFVFNAKITEASAELAYQKLTTPVFGAGVVYDCDNSLLMQQKKMAKDALTVQAFRQYVPTMIRETKDLIKEWPNTGSLDLFHEMSELTIRTASSCLLGKEIRAQLASNVAELYADLDRGFTPMNTFLSWLPTPRNIKRDKANKMMTETFKKIIQDRRDNNDMNNMDVLQTYMTNSYKDGTKMTDEEVAHMMIALLMAGQHTSSTTSTWTLFRLAQNPEVIEALRKEQSEILTGNPDTDWKDLPDFDYDHLKKMILLDYCMKETLRLHPPIHTIMRVVIKDIEYKGMTIPTGHYLCAAPCVSQLDAEKYPNPEKFDPWRHVNTEDTGEWTLNGVDIAQKSAKSHYLPFGAGRHRCIGEAFGYVQVKSIVASLLRQFDISLDTDKKTGETAFPEKDYTQLIVLPVGGSKINICRR